MTEQLANREKAGDHSNLAIHAHPSTACRTVTLGESRTDLEVRTCNVRKTHTWVDPCGDNTGSATAIGTINLNAIFRSSARPFLTTNFGTNLQVNFRVKRENQGWGQYFNGYVFLPEGAKTLAFEAMHKMKLDASKVRAIKLQGQWDTLYSPNVRTECAIEVSPGVRVIFGQPPKAPTEKRLQLIRRP